jgi:hypothetical protein
MAVEVKTALKQGDGEIHFPESLKEMMARVSAAISVDKMVTPSPERFDKELVV